MANGCSNAGCTVNNWGLTNLPVSTSEGLPWRKISQANAQKRCQALNDVDEKKFDLISRLEWIAISYNIERQAANWTNNDPVNGCLSRGNNAVDDVCGYIGLGRPEGGADVRDPRASMVLSTGEYIWDFAGNVWEWNNWELDFDNIHTAPGCSSNGPVWGHFDVASCAIIDPLLIMPLNELNLSPYNGSRGLGKLYPSGHGSPLAGGAYDRGTDINGLYSINLDGSLGATFPTSGFRCVYRKE